MELAILKYLLPWIAASSGAIAAAFMPSDDEPGERPLGNTVAASSAIIAAICSELVLAQPVRHFISLSFLACSIASFISPTKRTAAILLGSTIFATIPWMQNNAALSVGLLSLAAAIIAPIISSESRIKYLSMASLAFILAMFGTLLPSKNGLLLTAAALSWFGFILPFSYPESDEGHLIIVRGVVLPASVLALLGTQASGAQIGSLMIPIVGVSFALMIAKAFAKNFNPVPPLVSISAASLYLLKDPSPAMLAAHAAATAGLILATGNNESIRFARKLFMLSLAGAPFLGGFWPKFLGMKRMSLENHVAMSVIIAILSASWIYAIISRRGDDREADLPPPLITACIAGCASIVVVLGLIAGA